MIQNEFLLDHIGKTKTKKLIDDIESQAFEIKSKKFGIKDNSINPLAVVTSGIDDEIKQIGMSCINDLLLDNFGRLFNVAINRTQTAGFIDIDGNPHTFRRGTGDGFQNNQNVAIGARIRLGQGSTTPALDDFEVTTPFVGGVESTNKGTAQGFYTVGLSKVTNTVQFSPVSQNGTIRETGFYYGGKDNTAADILRIIMISHDLINPVVNFFIGEQVNVDYSFIFN